MSVINEMLRDLESGQRRRSGGAPPAGLVRPAPRRRWPGVLVAFMGLGLLVAAAAGWWFDREAARAPASAAATPKAGEADEAEPPSSRATPAPTEGNAMVDATDGSSAATDAAADADRGRAREPDAAAGGAVGRPADAPGEGPAVATPTLAAVSVDEGDRLTRLVITTRDGATPPRHRPGTDGGEIRLPGVEPASGIDVPAPDGPRLRGLSLVASDQGARLRYRTAPGVTAALAPSGGGDGTATITLTLSGGPVDAEATAVGDGVAGDEAGQSVTPDGRPEGAGASAGAAADGAQAPPAEPSEPSSATASAGEGRLERERRPPTAAERADAAYERGLDAIRAGEAGRARTALRDVLDQDADHSGAREALAMLLLQGGEPAAAGELLREGMAAGARTPTMVALYARSYLARGALREAVAVLEEGRGTVTPDADYLALLAALYQRQSRFDAAAAAYRAALRERPRVGAWWGGLGIALDNAGERPAAREAYDRALRVGGMGPSLAGYVRDRLADLGGTP